MKELTLKNTVGADLAELWAIHIHPEVAPHQYRIRKGVSLLDKILRLGELDSVEGLILKTLRIESNIVGYILTVQADSGEIRVAQSGWSLHPRYWGNGIMTNAMTHHLRELFGEQNRTHVLADCFVNNHRCKRLLDRLGFVPWQYPISDRIFRMWFSRSLKWENRYGITKQFWGKLEARRITGR